MIKLFIVIICFVFVLSEDVYVIKKNVGFENRDIELNVKYCDDGVCKDRANYSYFINDRLKNNIEILVYKNLIQKENNKIFVKTNGIRMMKDSKVISRYHKKIGLIGGNYDDYLSYKEIFFKYLAKIKNPINKLAMKYNLHNSSVYSVFFPKIKGSITITKSKSKSNNGIYFYHTKMNIFVNPIVARSGLDGNRYRQNIIKINKSLSLNSRIIAKKDDRDSLFYSLMQDISNKTSYALAKISSSTNNRYSRKPQIRDSDDNNYKNYPIYTNKRHNHSFTLGSSSIPFKVSLGRKYKIPASYSHYFHNVSFGYHNNIIDLYNIWISINMNIGKKDYLVIDETYALKKPLLLSLSASLKKKIYFNSNIYISPTISGSITKVNSSEREGFEGDTYVQNTNILLGGELGFSGNNHEISFWVKRSLANISKTIEGDKTYSTSISDATSFGLSYGYSF